MPDLKNTTKNPAGFTTSNEAKNESLLSFLPSAVGVNARRAFTLIELLVVIAIISLLSSVVLASLNGAREGARDARRQTDLNQIQLALEQIYAECGQYPVWPYSTKDMDDEFRVISGCDGDDKHLIDHMSQIPTDPNGGFYQYMTVSETEYCIGIDLEGSNPPDNDANCGEDSEGATDTFTDAGGEGVTYSISN